MPKIFFIFFFYCTFLNAQDKLFLKNGKTKKGIIVTVVRDFVYFKATDTSSVEKIKKSSLLLMEDYKGNRYLFSEQDTQIDSSRTSPKKGQQHRNILSVQPIAIFFGRANFSYEYLSKDGKIGFVIPLILTFDPSFGNIFTADTNGNSIRVKGISYITGLDINCYFGKKDAVKLFIGPRIRYGTDIAVFNTEGYSVQTQFGIRIGNPNRKIVQHLSFGFGFVRIISSSSRRYDAKQSQMWGSINYRLGVSW